MAVPNARVHVRFFQDHGFRRVADRSRKTWSFSPDIEEQKLRKKERPRAKRVVEVKEGPKIAVEPLPEFEMTSDEYARKADELIELRARIQKLQGQRASEGIS